MSTPSIRQAKIEDAALILKFVVDLAVYEKAENEVVATVADIESSIFNDQYNTNAIICELDGDAIGFAVYFFNYSTWQGKHGLYLEDLYVSPEHRGSGAGKALLKHLAKVAVDNACGRFEWSVLDWNEPAIQFYKSIGAKPKDGWTGYRMSGEALESFGSS